jgi:2-C-methyl-D-erythritol 4-phosphate cytidylyltransferase
VVESSDETAESTKIGGVGAIIVAAGRSRRMGGGDKLWVSLGGRPLLAHTLAVFQHCPSIHRIALVLAPGSEKLGHTLVKNALLTKVTAICAGGDERQDSVRAGLAALGPCDWVVVHDGARPLVTRQLIDQGLAAAKATGASTCAVPLHDMIKLVSEQGLVEQSLDRRRLWLVQTPQVFRYETLVEAHRAAAKQPPANDDAALVERLGHQVKVYMGSYHNMKVTTPDDMVIAQILLRWHRG